MDYRVPESKWEWFGHAAHFICGQWCRFHMATKVGDYLISTVGMYVHPRHSQGNERAEAEWLAEHPNGEEIGCGRTYETFVFKAGARCDAEGCNCGLPAVGGCELDLLPANDAGTARSNHIELCNKWAVRAAEHLAN